MNLTDLFHIDLWILKSQKQLAKYKIPQRIMLLSRMSNINKLFSFVIS